MRAIFCSSCLMVQVAVSVSRSTSGKTHGAFKHEHPRHTDPCRPNKKQAKNAAQAKAKARKELAKRGFVMHDGDLAPVTPPLPWGKTSPLN